ncbi:MAG: aldehyde dehydrogenase family protein [Acidobacteriota bacterium]|nr:aldehyde dehydrogenase family protein [Acidobacteriota bacterium]
MASHPSSNYARQSGLSPAATTWAQTSLHARLRVLARARHLLADCEDALIAATPAELVRTPADTLVAELLPLLEAMRFLEREAASILRPRRPGRRGLPLWLTGITSEVQRVPLGTVLIIGPSNYPLLLPGVQAMQALAAGNTVVWKPGRGGGPMAAIVANALYDAGLPQSALTITEDSVEAAEQALARGADKVIFTGSATAGRAVMTRLAGTATPCVMELSGCDAVVVTESAELDLVVRALCFGLRLNGSATCMAPRRIFLTQGAEAKREALVQQLRAALPMLPAVPLPSAVQIQLQSLVQQAVDAGATAHGSVLPQQPALLLTGVTPAMAVAQADLFAPVLMLMEPLEATDLADAIAACPYRLTVSLFGREAEARRLAERLSCGSVLINDMIAPTADPRMPFGGRGQSGFGVTRGAEGLLEMTAPRVLQVRRGGSMRHLQPTTSAHQALLGGLVRMLHGAGWRARWNGCLRMIQAAAKLR